MLDLQNPIYSDADKAREHLESLLWPEGPTCPHCGVIDQATLMKGKSTRPGVYQCNACRKPFSVTVGTLFERSKVPLNKWVLAVHLLSSSKKGMSAHQIHRMLGVTYKTAWFMTHRIREAMREGSDTPLGGGGQTVESDETFIGGKKKDRNKFSSKKAVVSLVHRGGEIRSFHVEKVNVKNLKPILFTQIEGASYDLNATRGEIDQISNDSYSRAGLKEYIDKNRRKP